MDQAENLRNIIKKQNQKDLSNARVIAVTSGKGGVGKSSVSINLAVQFTQMGKKVIILDSLMSKDNPLYEVFSTNFHEKAEKARKEKMKEAAYGD